MKKLLLLIALLPLVVWGQPLGGGGQGPFPKSLPVVVLTAPPVGTDFSGALQATIDALPRATSVFSGIGGGKISFGPGTYTLSTNITIPNYTPFSLHLEGAGYNATIFRSSGNTNFGLWNVATNGWGLTNFLNLVVNDCGFVAENQFQTNFIWDVTGQVYSRFYNCLFTSAYALTNGQGAYSLNWEANVPNAPIGIVGLAINKEQTGANASFSFDHNVCYGLASAIVINSFGVPITHINYNYFSCCGIYNSTLPPANNTTTIHYATNLWRGDPNNANNPVDYIFPTISAGAALSFVGGSGDMEVSHNEFFGCGAMVSLNGAQSAGGDALDPIRFYDNRPSTTRFRILSPDIGEAIAIDDHGTSSGGDPFDAKVATLNGCTQTNGGGPPTVYLPLNVHKQAAGTTRFIGESGGVHYFTNGLAGAKSVATASSAISFPNTTVNWTNTQGFNIILYIDNTGVTGTLTKKNGQQIYSALVGDVALALKPGDYFSETYTVGTPSARWEPQ